MDRIALFDTLASVLTTVFVNGLWQGVVLMGLVWGLMRFAEAKALCNAATRYGVWTVTLIAVLSLPLLWGVVLSHRSGSVHVAAHPVAANEQGEVLDVLPATVQDVPTASVDANEGVMSNAVPVANADAVRSKGALPLSVALGRGILVVVGLCFVLSLMLFVRVVWGYGVLRRLKRQSLPLPLSYQRSFYRWRREGGIRRPIRMAQSDALTTPVAAGYLRPMILIPSSLLGQLTPEEFEQVILHELAHLQRWDDWTNLLQKLAEAVFFFHPAVYVIARHMSRERELACDDWVVTRTRQPKTYAQCLARLVELQVGARSVQIAPGMAMPRAHVVGRVQRLLDSRRVVTARLATKGLLLVAAVLALSLFLMTAIAPVFALDDGPTSSDGQEMMQALLPASAVSREARAVETEVGEPSGAVSEEVDEREVIAPSAVEVTPSSVLDIQPVSVRSVEKAPSGTALAPSETVLTYQALPEIASLAPESRPVGEVHRQDLSVASWIKLLRTAARISSSGDKTRLLMETAERIPDNEDVFNAYLESAGTIASSGDRKRALSALLKHHRLGTAALVTYLGAVKTIPSGGDKTRLLVEVARVLPDDDAVRDAYIDVAETISSPGDYRRAISALIQSQGK